MATVAENLNRILDAKTALRDAIIAKGGELTEEQLIDEYAFAIEALPEGATITELNINANGTYTAPAGTAYSPVVVNVPTDDNLARYLDGSLMNSEGVLDLTGYPELFSYMFSQRKYQVINNLILDPNTEVIPSSCFMNGKIYQITWPTNLKKIGSQSLGSIGNTFAYSTLELPNSVTDFGVDLFTAPTSGSPYTGFQFYGTTLKIGENIKNLCIMDAYNLEELQILATEAPTTIGNSFENFGIWAGSLAQKKLLINCWAFGYEGGRWDYLFNDRGFTKEYLQTLNSVAYTGDTKEFNGYNEVVKFPITVNYTDSQGTFDKDVDYKKTLITMDNTDWTGEYTFNVGEEAVTVPVQHTKNNWYDGYHFTMVVDVQSTAPVDYCNFITADDVLGFFIDGVEQEFERYKTFSLPVGKHYISYNMNESLNFAIRPSYGSYKVDEVYVNHPNLDLSAIDYSPYGNNFVRDLLYIGPNCQYYGQVMANNGTAYGYNYIIDNRNMDDNILTVAQLIAKNNYYAPNITSTDQLPEYYYFGDGYGTLYVNQEVYDACSWFEKESRMAVIKNDFTNVVHQ